MQAPTDTDSQDKEMRTETVSAIWEGL